MKKDLISIIVLLAALISSCSHGKESTGVWVNKEKMNGKSYHSVFIVVMSADIQARSQLENDLAAIASAHGYKVVKSMDVLPTSLKDPKLPEKDSIVAKVELSGCDAVFVASLLKKEENVHYTPGSTAYALQPYATYYPGYYSHWAPTVSTPDYYSHEKNYFMQSNLYDVASREVMWSVQSQVFNPSSLKKFSSAYTSTLIEQLEKAGFLKK